jgi:hypothetical protein
MSHDLESRFDRAMKKADKFEARSKALHKAKRSFPFIATDSSRKSMEKFRIKNKKQ